MIRVPYRGSYIECSTCAEAIEVLKHLDAEASKMIKRTSGPDFPTGFEALIGALNPKVEVSHWTRDSFWHFIGAVGEPQSKILALLVDKKRVTDTELRKALKLETNQQLAGVLSGISKQAGAQNIPARAVYTIENESKCGEVTKTYVVSHDFLKIALEMNWEGQK